MEIKFRERQTKEKRKIKQRTHERTQETNKGKQWPVKERDREGQGTRERGLIRERVGAREFKERLYSQ